MKSVEDMTFILRNFAGNDAQAVNALALRAFEQFQDAYEDWPVFRARLDLASLGGVGEVIVAEVNGQIAGAVAYLGPGAPKAPFFQPDWPVMRMLVVSPDARGLGIGRVLAEECLRRAKRDGAKTFALHTSALMHVALPMYERMGFKRIADASAIHGVNYGVYLKEL